MKIKFWFDVPDNYEAAKQGNPHGQIIAYSNGPLNLPLPNTKRYNFEVEVADPDITQFYGQTLLQTFKN